MTLCNSCVLLSALNAIYHPLGLKVQKNKTLHLAEPVRFDWACSEPWSCNPPPPSTIPTHLLSRS